MKKILFLSGLALMLGATSYACDGGGKKEGCCKGKSEKTTAKEGCGDKKEKAGCCSKGEKKAAAVDTKEIKADQPKAEKVEPTKINMKSGFSKA
jgi:hypothetical protein